MTHRFPLKEIAQQAGLGTATVDRVLNNRAHVSAQTRARVMAAIAELAGQEAQLAARGRRMFFDFVIEAPARFSREVQGAVEAVIPHIGGAVCRPRFKMMEVMADAEVAATLARIAKRGSDGVCLKARDSAPIRAAVARLAQAGIPVVTLVTDVEAEGRIAYIGVDNRSAGRTAALLIGQRLLGQRLRAPATVLATRSAAGFTGEESRLHAFREALADYAPYVDIMDVPGGGGVHHGTQRVLADALNRVADIGAVYSMGGGNRAIVETLSQAGIKAFPYIAHDLDRANRALIEAGQVDFILHHDLQADMHNVFRAFLQHHRLVAGQPANHLSPVQIISRENVPP